MEASRIVVISDSFHTMLEALALLKTSGHSITCVSDLTRWHNLSSKDAHALREADAVIMGRVLDPVLRQCHWRLT